jgi:hypothetical protein
VLGRVVEQRDGIPDAPAQAVQLGSDEDFAVALVELRDGFLKRGTVEVLGTETGIGKYERLTTGGHLPVLKAMADSEGVRVPTVSKWLKKARERGLLGYPDRPGRPGFTEKSSPWASSSSRSTVQRKRATSPKKKETK